MVTPDKDFGQLVSDYVRILKPGRAGSDIEVLGPMQICERWGITDPKQVIDILALMGDASDNIPGVPGIGEKTAQKLIAQFGSVESLLERVSELTGKQREKIEQNVDMARLSKKLVTINDKVPLSVGLDDLALQKRNDDAVRSLMVEWEFNSIGQRLFGKDFKAGRGFKTTEVVNMVTGQADLFADLKTIATVPHHYRLADTPEAVSELAVELAASTRFCFDTETDGLDARACGLVGVAFSTRPHTGWYVPVSAGGALATLAPLLPLLADGSRTKTGHNLKFDLSVLLAHGIPVAGPFVDTMIAHHLVEPDQRHGMDALAEKMLGYTPVPIEKLIGSAKPQKTMRDVPVDQVAEYAAEDADVTLQLEAKLLPMLKKEGLEPLFQNIEMPLLPVLVQMEADGVAVDLEELRRSSVSLEALALRHEQRVYELAGQTFNLNSPKQLGEILFDKLQLVDKAKKTATGQYATNEQVLETLSGEHEIVREILSYREVTKLKSTYVDALPGFIQPRTGRVHTTFLQTGAATGRLASNNPNLQNIPIRSALGQEIRRAFIPSDPARRLLSADYSQIELRVMASMSGDPAMIEAFQRGLDIHTATAARVFGVPLDGVTGEMRRRAKMVNFGIIYGISAFGLSQRLGIPRSESAEIIRNYFEQYPGVKAYMDRVVEEAKAKGYVETLTGRRRHLRDITSANATIRAGAERAAINAPIQGTAADMIKIAMVRIHAAMASQGLRSRMVLQVHDELVFDLVPDEETRLRTLVTEGMTGALALQVPVQVEIGVGANWLEAHG